MLLGRSTPIAVAMLLLVAGLSGCTDEKSNAQSAAAAPPPPAVTVAKPTKKLVSLRIDPDVLDKFKAGGVGWQSRMNDALRKAAGLK